MSSILLLGATGRTGTQEIQVRYVPDKPASMRISRREVARFAVDAIADDSLIGKAPIISSK
jgi:hypothetical protein